MNESDDIQLLRAIRQGDAAAFQNLYRRHRSGLYSFALLHSGAPDVAADVVQEVFMGLLGDSYGFDPLKGMLGNFLYGVARNLVLSHARQNSRWVQPAGGDDEDDGLAQIVDTAAKTGLLALGRLQRSLDRGHDRSDPGAIGLGIALGRACLETFLAAPRPDQVLRARPQKQLKHLSVSGSGPFRQHRSKIARS